MGTSNLRGKIIVFIAPIFYDYHLEIIREMENRGAKVIFLPERKYNLIYSIYLNISKRLLYRYQKRYYDRIANLIISFPKIDYLFVIRGCQMPVTFVPKVKQKHVGVQIIMYQWDSQKNNPYIHLKEQFNKILTFDFNDSESLDIEYLPLFFTRDIRKIGQSTCEKMYNFFYISIYTYERYLQLLRLIEKIDSNEFKYYLYIPKTTFIKEILKGRNLNKRLFAFKPMSRKEYLKNLEQSRWMIDLTHSSQSGLPMRIIEAVGASLGVLSTNLNVTREFLGKADVEVLSNDLDFNSDRFRFHNAGTYALIDEYLLTHWIDKIFK